MTEQTENKLLSFSPHKYQQIALDSTARFIACLSGIQGGKTTIGALWLLLEIHKSYLSGKRGDWLIAAPTVKILEQSTIPKFLEWLPADWGTYKDQRKCIDLAWGNKIYIRSADEPDYLEGMTALGAWLDEAGQMSYEAWVNIQGRLSINQGRAILTTTPYTQIWLRREIILKAGHRNEEDLTSNPELDSQVHLVEWTSVDNPAFPKAEFDRMEKKLSPEIFKRRYLGKYSTMEGLVYKTFSPDTHVVKPFTIPVEWVRFGGADFGNTNPTAIIPIAKKPEVREPLKDGKGKVVEPSKYYIYREFYRVKPLLKEVNTFLEMENLNYCLGDPRAAQEMDEIRRFHGYKRISAADNRVDIGIERIDTLLRENRLFFFEGRCPNTVREIQEYHYAAPSEDRQIKDIPVPINNHAMDALKYAFSREIKEIYNRRPALRRGSALVSRQQIKPSVINSYTGYM